MNIYKIAEMNIAISSPSQSHLKLCKNYLSSSNGDICPELVIDITADQVEEEMKLYSYPCSFETATSTAIYRRICRHAISKGGFFLHSAVIEYNGSAYGFLAPSGTGKSTHIKLWREILGSKVLIVNGDKPLVMPNSAGGFTAYGTPWCGKEGWQRNVGVPLAAICILERGKENSICEIPMFSAMEKLMRQTYLPNDKNEVERLFDNLNNFMSCNIKCYRMKCTPEPEAAIMAFEAMTGDKIQNS